MSTHCTISHILPDGTYEGIYVHSDGYPDWMGNMLKEHYATQELADSLVALGDASCIYPKLSPDASRPHTFENRQEGVCLFYHRDRGDDWADAMPTRAKSYPALLHKFANHHHYLFKDGQWYYRGDSDAIDIPVSEVE